MVRAASNNFIALYDTRNWRWLADWVKSILALHWILLSILLAATAFTQDARIVLLGTGTPNPEPERSGPAVAVIAGSRVYVVDLGPGVVRRAASAGVTMKQLTRGFVTHLHSDHTIGLPDFIFTPAVTGRSEPLQLFGPPGLRAMTANILKAWRQDINIRLHGMEPSIRNAYVVKAQDVRPGEIYRDDTVRVIAFAVDHGTWKHAYGYRFEIGSKVFVISGDTTFSEKLIAAAKGADVLVHEVYSEKGWNGRTADWKKYHAAFHTSGPDVGRAATRAGVKKLVLYHQLLMGEKPEQMLEEVRNTFTGEVLNGKDLDVIK